MISGATAVSLPADECATLAPAGSFRRCNVCRGRADYLCSDTNNGTKGMMESLILCIPTIPPV